MVLDILKYLTNLDTSPTMKNHRLRAGWDLAIRTLQNTTMTDVLNTNLSRRSLDEARGILGLCFKKGNPTTLFSFFFFTDVETFYYIEKNYDLN